jgi:hypothetical protein
MVLMLVVCSSLALAAPTGGNVTEGATTHGTGSTSEQVTAYGGNVTEVNVSGTSITTKWVGFYGFIDGGIQLTDSAANKFYEWTISDLTGGFVYAASAAVTDWTTIKAMNTTSVPAGVAGAASDNYAATFTANEAFQSQSIGPIANTPYALTWQNGAQGTLKTYALIDDDGSTNIWAGLIDTAAQSFKAGQQVDYQILAPADAATGTVYNFYLEMP